MEESARQFGHLSSIHEKLSVEIGDAVTWVLAKSLEDDLDNSNKLQRDVAVAQEQHAKAFERYLLWFHDECECLL